MGLNFLAKLPPTLEVLAAIPRSLHRRSGNTPGHSPNGSCWSLTSELDLNPSVKKSSSLSTNCIVLHRSFLRSHEASAGCCILLVTPRLLPNYGPNPTHLWSWEPPLPWTSQGQQDHNLVTSTRYTDAKHQPKNPKAFFLLSSVLEIASI